MVETASTQPRENEQQANPTTRRQEVIETKHYNEAAKSHVHTEWETRWNKYLDTRINPTPAEERSCSKDTRQMRYKMTRRENTVATLVRSECIGFKAFLARVRVPGFEDPYCDCGGGKQTAKRIIMHCSLLDHTDLFSSGGPMDYKRLVSTEQGIRKVTKWILENRLLQQFNLYTGA